MTTNIADLVARPVFEAERDRMRDRVLRLSIPEPNTGCWLWLGSQRTDGYGHSNGFWNKKGVAHRLSYTVFIGPIPDGLVVMHKCDQPLCVNPEHLVTGTYKENTADMLRKNRRVAPAQLRKVVTKDILKELVSRWEPGSLVNGIKPLAREFGIHVATVRSAIKRARSALADEVVK